MKLLLVKTSSLGDVVHALPAVTEALDRVADLEIDWVIEDDFAPIAERHPGVRRVIPVAVRRWRKGWLAARAGITGALSDLRSRQYDLVLDSQGLLKSALLAVAARGPHHGYDAASAREGIATLLYRQRHAIAHGQHAIYRQKQLMAAALGYRACDDIDYGLPVPAGEAVDEVVLLHGTTWPSKEWPVALWQDLAGRIAADNYRVLVPSGNDEERQRAVSILGSYPGEVLHGPALGELMDRIAGAAGVVSVDTGLGHLAPAFGRPVIGLFGATDHRLTGILGARSEIIVSDHLPCIPCRKRRCRYEKPGDSSSIYPPCYSETSPEAVWQALRLLIGSHNSQDH